MSLSNAQLAAALAPLIEALCGVAPNTGNESTFATALANLLSEANVLTSTGVLSQNVTTLTTQVQALIAGFDLLNPVGAVATVAALANVASPAAGDIYYVESNSHNYGYLLTNGAYVWIDLGPMQGPAGTLTIGGVTTGAAGSSAQVTNIGTAQAAVLEITIPQGLQGIQGYAGWSPVLAVVSNGSGGYVYQVSAWIGGAGAAPTAGQYVGASGFVSTAAAAVNVQGPQGVQGPSGTLTIGGVTTGAAGSSAQVTNIGTAQAAVLEITIPQGLQGIQGYAGWSPVFAAVSNGSGGYVLQVESWQGGAGAPPASGQYVGSTGLVSSAAAAVNIQGPTGPNSWATPVAWSPATLYVAAAPASVVTNGGSSYLCIVTHTSGSTFDPTKFAVIAAAGASGAGAGNVNTSGAVTAGHYAVYADGTGTVLQDGGAPSALDPFAAAIIFGSL